jgi:hypothetical protein
MDDVSRQAVRQRLEEIREANGGILSAEAIVEDARQKDSPLHGEFEWHVKTAAYQYWLDTARKLIRSVRVVVSEETVMRAPKYVRDPRAENDTQGYVSLYSLRTDEDAAQATVMREFHRIESALRRAQSVADVLGFRDVLDDLLEQIISTRQRLRKAA